MSRQPAPPSANPPSADAEETRFCVVGVMKAGTTSLWSMMDSRPDFAVRGAGRRRKEVGMLYLPFLSLTPGWRRRYDDILPSHPGARFRGEVNPSYIYYDQALDRLKELSPDMRVILLLRDPVERAHSHWWMNRMKGRESRSFADCVRADLRWRAVLNAPVLGPPLRRALRLTFLRWYGSYVDRGFYAEQVERLFRRFPRDRVLVLDSDVLKNNHARAWRRIAAFLGAPPTPAPRPQRLNRLRRPEIDAETRMLLTRVYAKDQRRLSDLLVGTARPLAKARRIGARIGAPV